MKVEWTVSGLPSAQDTFVGRCIFKEKTMSTSSREGASPWPL